MIPTCRIYKHKIKIKFSGCDCGKFNKKEYLDKGIICDACGTESRSQREISINVNK